MIWRPVLSAVLFVLAALGWGFAITLSASRASRGKLVLLVVAAIVASTFSSILLVKDLAGILSHVTITSAATVYLIIAVIPPVVGYFLHHNEKTDKLFSSVIKLFEVNDTTHDRSNIIEEILDRKEETGEINVVERELLESVLKFNDKTVREVMIPRGDIVALNVDEPPRKILRRVSEEGYSRLPVFRGSIDNILGIIYAKDLLNMAEEGAAIVLQDMLRSPYYVPETKKISDLLREMQKNKVHLAVVVDEFGGTEGIITLEDVLEEIVGEIQDEYDESQQELARDETGAVHFSGLMRVERFNELLDAKIPEDDDYDTMAGFVQKLAGKLPQKGEIYGFEEMFFNVEDLARHRIKRLKVSFKEHPVVENKSSIIAPLPALLPVVEESAKREAHGKENGVGRRVSHRRVSALKKGTRKNGTGKARKKN